LDLQPRASEASVSTVGYTDKSRASEALVLFSLEHYETCFLHNWLPRLSINGQMDELLSQEAKFQSFRQEDCSFVFLADVLPKALGEIYL
jgi:hypothetical protein